MGATRTERAEDPGGCGGEDRGLWRKGGRLSPHRRASRRGDSGLGRADRSGSDRHGFSGGRWDKEGSYGQRIGLGCAARTLPRVGGARVRPLSRTLGTALYSPKCLEGEFSGVGLPFYGVLRSWPGRGTRRYDGPKEAGAITPRPSTSPSKRRALRVDPYLAVESEVPPVALALELVVILVVRRPPGNGSPLRSQHITAARWVGRIEHQALIRWPCAFIFLELREVELTPRQRDAI